MDFPLLSAIAYLPILGGLLIFRGLAWWITEGRTVAPMDPNFQLLGGGLDGSIGEFCAKFGEMIADG